MRRLLCWLLGHHWFATVTKGPEVHYEDMSSDDPIWGYGVTTWSTLQLHVCTRCWRGKYTVAESELIHIGDYFDGLSEAARAGYLDPRDGL
jgi:hypothetical protein